MSDEKKKPSWFGKIQPRKSSCCNVIIEELDEEGEEDQSPNNSTATGAGDKASIQEQKK